MKDIERLAADSNTMLQMQGANEFLAKASRALVNAMVLGGEPPDTDIELNRVLHAVRDLLRLTVALGYRHKRPFFTIAQSLGLSEEHTVRLLAEHFDEHPEIAHEWLTAETERRAQTK